MSATVTGRAAVASHRRLAILAVVALSLSAVPIGTARAADDNHKIPEGPDSRHTYDTGGVHNDKGCVPASKCIYARQPGQPSDPLYPAWWSSAWTMYRVFNNYEKFPPPYSSPPQGLMPGDYQVSYGATYYDSSYVPADHDGTGAMMEHYEKYCLPIFPTANNYSCSFISLGNKAYFITYADRPPGMPVCCQFSLHNHPPLRDFIKHLPYNAGESAHLGGTIQAYSMRPEGILFGYAFYKDPAPDTYDPKATPYRHPQSFYFAGDPGYPQPGDPPNAPIVSQNYTSFRMEKPDPAKTWDQVAQMCPAKPGWCCLFATDCVLGQQGQASFVRIRPAWSTIRPSAESGR